MSDCSSRGIWLAGQIILLPGFLSAFSLTKKPNPTASGGSMAISLDVHLAAHGRGEHRRRRPCVSRVKRASRRVEKPRYCVTGEKRVSLKDYRFHGKVKEAEEGGAGRANYIKVISPVKTFPLVVSPVPWDNIQICPEWLLCSCSGGLTGGPGRGGHERGPGGTLLPPFHLQLPFDFAHVPLGFHGG